MNRNAMLIGLALAAVAAGMVASSGSGDAPTSSKEPGEMAEQIKAMGAKLGLDEHWQVFLVAAALGESGFDTNRGLGRMHGAPPWADMTMRTSEANAAQQSWDRNHLLFAGCGHPEEHYTFGTGGLWGQIPSSALFAFRATPAMCTSPWSVFDPWAALIMLVDSLKRSMHNRKDKFLLSPTWGNLRVSMRAPSLMGKPEELERQRTGHKKLGDRLVELGYPRSFVDEHVTPLPPDFDPATALEWA